MERKILIIEDNALDAAVVKEVLENEGFKVYVAMTGEEGIKTAFDVKPDLITLDLVLPDISGFEVCSRIKKDPELKNTIVIILSIRDSLDDIRKAFTAEADDYVIKLPRSEFLVKKIKLYLGMERE